MKKAFTILFGEYRPKSFQIVWLLFRLHAGLSIAIGAGYSKLSMPEWFTTQVGDIGFTFPSPFFWAWLAVWGEFMGGLLIAFGLFTRLAAFQLTFQFFVISFIWYEAPEPVVGMYYQQLFFWAFALITIVGGGRFSFDALIFKRLTTKWSKAILIPVLLLLFANPSFAQSSRINGNGNITTSMRIVGDFHAVNIEDYCNVEISCGQMAKLEIVIDENLLSRLKTTVNNGVLNIEADGWIEPTQILVKIAVPFITQLSNGAWGKIDIRNIDTRSFELNASVGHVYLSGKTEKLTIHAGTGQVDALQLNAKEALINHESHAETKVTVSEKLAVHLQGGSVAYRGNPVNIDKALEAGAQLNNLDENVLPAAVPDLVNVTLKNHTTRKLILSIKGPREQAFSYGFSILPFGSRKKKVPVGTQILNSEGETLITISAADDGKKLNLF